MMVQPVPFIVLVAVLLINTLFYCSAENVYCVTPTATSCSSCSHNTHCATLSEYAQEAEMYFTSNTTMLFLPGDHVLDWNITVVNVVRLTMCGESSSYNMATIVRNGSVGFSFTNMVDFNIYSLAFTSYKRSWSYGSHPASNSALFFLQSIQHAKLVNCSFHDNIGTALAVSNTSITLTGNNEFVHNQCGCGLFSYNCELGCGITALNSNLTFIGNTTFCENNASYHGSGGAIWASASSLDFDGTNNFIGNSAERNGGAIYAETNSLLSFSGTSNFCHNTAELFGGAIEAHNNTLLHFSGTNNFTNNSAQSGGAIEGHVNVVFTLNGMNNFINNSAEFYGGAIASFNVKFTFNGINSFMSNSAEFGGGGAIHAQTNSSLTFKGTIDFSHNSAYRNDGGAINTHTNTEITFAGTSSFSNNSAVKGGAISAYYNSTLTFDGNISFTNNGHNTNETDMNTNTRGGAIYLAFSSFLFLMPNTTVYWENNHARLGGAIYVFDINPLIYCTNIATFIAREQCFFQLPGQNLSNGLDVKLNFKNNSADDAGSVLYGGAIDHCKLTHGLNSYSSGEVFDMLFSKNARDYNTASKISSDPLHICLCKDNLPDCRGSRYYTVPYPQIVYPGETFHISVVAVGQRDGTVPSTVRGTVKDSYIIDSNQVNLLDYQYLQHTNNTCTKLNFTLFSLSQTVTIELYPEGSPCPGNDRLLNISMVINQTCPPGFNISESARSCVCEPRLTQYTKQCYITDGVGYITRESDETFWAGYNYISHELILHPHCPFDYCVNDAVVFSLDSTENTDVQCAYNRSGLLCGHCREGYSLTLGSFHCSMQCTNNYLSLLILFAVMGVALVFLLLVCKLTVATGTLSGLVFYANIVGADSTTFLPQESTTDIHYILSVFIAWLNLDFGIETCFYKGMDAYSKTWLQFVFPVYIWVQVGLMILVSHYSQRFASLLGNNPISILATLIHLSYAKILRTIITAVTFTDLRYPTYYRRAWFYDANIDYLVGKHIPLFLVAVLVFLFLFLPYTFLLFCYQWLQTISHLKVFSWVNSARLKSFMDSYHAPYKAKHRYWPGVLLVLRFVLLLVFAYSPKQYPSINLLAILVGAGILQLWAWVSGGVYKNWCLDALEGSFVLNLIILVGTSMYINIITANNRSGEDQLAVSYTSVTIALATFIAILAYHIFRQLRHTNLWKKIPKLNMKLMFKKMSKKLSTKEAADMNIVTNDTTESVKFDQLREPLLDDLPQPTHSVV